MMSDLTARQAGEKKEARIVNDRQSAPHIEMIHKHNEHRVDDGISSTCEHKNKRQRNQERSLRAFHCQFENDIFTG